MALNNEPFTTQHLASNFTTRLQTYLRLRLFLAQMDLTACSKMPLEYSSTTPIIAFCKILHSCSFHPSVYIPGSLSIRLYALLMALNIILLTNKYQMVFVKMSFP